MATYNEMLVATRGSDSRPLIEREGAKRFTFVCGSERVLVEEVVAAIKEHVAPADLDYVQLYAGEVKDAEIWAALNQFPLSAERWDTPTQSKITPRRLVVVRDVERIRHWAPLPEWLLSAEQGYAGRALVVAVFVSGKEEWPSDWFPDVRDRVVRSGRLVECKPLKEEEAIAYVSKFGAMEEKLARFLLERVRWDIAEAVNCMRKLRYFKARDEALISRFTSLAPAEDFVLNVLAGRKESALEALESVPLSEISRVLGRLDDRLMHLARLNRVSKTKSSVREIIAASKVPAFVAVELLPLAKQYDLEKVSNCTKVLAFCDDAQRRGAGEGVLEVLVSKW